jgi:DNA-binding transcriptional ArsR family regulator
MPGSRFDLIFHPIRLRIITAVSSQRVTAHELAEALPDVPQTTLYRHLSALVEGGLLDVVEENPIRGTVERVYAMPHPPSLSPEDLRGMTRETCEQTSNLYFSSLMNDTRLYLESKPAGEEFDLIADGVDISKIQLLLSDEEFRAMSRQIQELMLAAARNTPSANRKRRIFAYQFIPGAG